MFKTETHLHTSEGSGCAKIPAEEIVKLYYDAGYKTIFVSNHFGTHFFERWGELSWDETIDRFMLGYYNAKAAGEKLGMNVLFAAEISFEKVGGHYLVYGVDADFLKMYPYLTKMSLEEFSKIAKQHGLLLIHAHPYRDQKVIVEPQSPQFVDGFEVCNTNPRHIPNDEHAEQTAAKFGLYRTAGSDAHRYEDVAGAAMLSENEIKTVEDYIALVKSGKAELYKSKVEK